MHVRVVCLRSNKHETHAAAAVAQWCPSLMQVVGVHMVGDYSAEIMQGIAIAMKCGVKKSHFDTTVGIHPTSAEEFVSMRQKTRRVEGKGSAHSYSDLA